MENLKFKDVIDRWIDRWNSKNLDEILDCYSNLGELFDPKIKDVFPNKLVLKGKDELRTYFKVILELFPELKIKPRGLWLKGDYEGLLEYDLYVDKTKKIDIISKFYLNSDFKIQGHFIYYGLSYLEKIDELN